MSEINAKEYFDNVLNSYEASLASLDKNFCALASSIKSTDSKLFDYASKFKAHEIQQAVLEQKQKDVINEVDLLSAKQDEMANVLTDLEKKLREKYATHISNNSVDDLQATGQKLASSLGTLESSLSNLVSLINNIESNSANPQLIQLMRYVSDTDKMLKNAANKLDLNKAQTETP